MKDATKYWESAAELHTNHILKKKILENVWKKSYEKINIPLYWNKHETWKL